MRNLFKTSLILLLILISDSISAQNIKGVVVNDKRQPVESVAIILQLPDSTYVDAAISAPNGTFLFEVQPQKYRMLFQHLLYKNKYITGNSSDAGTIVLEPKNFKMKEVVVKGEQPLVKVENGRLAYNLSVLSEKRVVNNAYEAISKIPGVHESNGKFTLVGADNLTVIINGKPTTMNAKQLQALLQNTPVDRVEKAEVMYSAPPELHVKGAAINVVMKRGNDYSFQGEIGADYTNSYFNTGGVKGNFRVTTPKTSLDLMYNSFCDDMLMNNMQIYSKHTLGDKVYNIDQYEKHISKSWVHNVRAALEYNFNKKNYLDIVYTGSFTPREHAVSTADGSFQKSRVSKLSDTDMHNFSANYTSGFGLKAGGDYTRYTTTANHKMTAVMEDNTENRFALQGGQQIDSYSIYADQSHKLPNSWEIGYGASFRHVKNYDYQNYSDVAGSIAPENSDSRLNESTTDFYVSVSKRWKSGPAFSLSATGEYYSIGNYHKWAVFPQASLTYLKTPKHIFQLSLSTGKDYPDYWAMKSSVTYTNAYTEMQGTPGLRPMTVYNLNANYILMQKYVFGLFFSYKNDFFAQVPYQATDRLALVYKYMNWNYAQMTGINVVVPISVKDWYNADLTLVGIYARQKCDNFFDIPFDRNKFCFVGTMNNTFRVGKHLSFELNAHLQTPFIQGTMDITEIFELSAGVKWNFAGDKCSLSTQCRDIFNTGVPETKVRYNGQNLLMKPQPYSRSFSINFTYRFGGWKQKKYRKADTSRFGH